jgi:hypothetical protein
MLDFVHLVCHVVLTCLFCLLFPIKLILLSWGSSMSRIGFSLLTDEHITCLSFRDGGIILWKNL